MLLARLLPIVLWSAVTLAARPVDVLPARPGEGAIQLHGRWSFRYVAGLDAKADEGFTAPSFPVEGWSTIQVPGHWELQGFAEPQYADAVPAGLGLYRRTFQAPSGWRGQRVFLRFDGVLFGFKAWLNGRPIGEWASGFNPVTFDVTDALRADGAENVLAVRVTTRSRGWDFDTMDCWSLAGIYRDVTLFARPALHLSDYTARTTLAPSGAAGLDLEVAATGPATVAGRLLSPEGELAGSFDLNLDPQGKGSTRLEIRQPRLWTSETPHLYRLELELRSAAGVVQRFSDRIGLRQVTIQDGVLRLNGTAIKLRGIDHHDIWPEEGRVATEERMRRDLELMRGAHINFIRTSHYPPHPRLIELCDELGFYVDCEVPFIHGRKNLGDPSYQDALLTRARATVMRDKNRPSVILWSVGNENHVNELGLNAGRHVKELDPTRPITFPTMGSHFRGNWERYPEDVDLYSPHYPSAGTVRDYAGQLTRPIVVTEYAHQRGLARGGTRLAEIWEAMWQSPRVAGGAIWLFQDQGILRRTRDPARVVNGDLMVWLDQERYYDTNGYYGVDGIVYSDRTPQTDYWEVRKVYSPVQVTSGPLKVRPGPNRIGLTVENRHDFRSLAGLTLRWTARRNGVVLLQGSAPLTAPPRQSEVVTAAFPLPDAPGDDLFTLDLQVVDERGAAWHERGFALETGLPAGARSAALQRSLPSASLRLETSEAAFVVTHPAWRLSLDRKTGRLRLTDPQGGELLSAAGPHTGRKLTINDLGKKREGAATHWEGELLQDVQALRTSAEKSSRGVTLKVAGRYPRPGFPDQAIEGECELQVRPTGAITVSYRYVPVNARDAMVEAGFSFAVPAALSQFRWLGQGPYATYPGKERLSEYGAFHLDREDLYFPGNRRGVEFGLLTSPKGSGVLITGEDLTLSVEHRGETTLLSHVAAAQAKKSKAGSGDGRSTGENVDGKAEFNAASVKAITGRFELLPLDATWPEPLRRWIGSPTDTVPVRKPFLRSYDQ